MALMLFLVRRYRPETGLTTRVAATLLLGLANVAPFLLRRPAVYEVAIAAGYLCLMAGLYLTLTGVLRDRPSLVRVAAGSLALGLAVGARPHLILALPVWIWAWARLWRARESGRRAVVRLAAAALAPLGICLALLGLYNVARFGSLTEFGSSYQLAGINAHTLDRFSLDRVVPGIFFYLLAPPHLDTVFPFAHLLPDYPGTCRPRTGRASRPSRGSSRRRRPPARAGGARAPAGAPRGRARADRPGLPAAALRPAGAGSTDPQLQRRDDALRGRLRQPAPAVGAAGGAPPEDELRGVVVRRVAAAVAACATVVAVLFALAFSVVGYSDLLRGTTPTSTGRWSGSSRSGRPRMTAPDEWPRAWPLACCIR